MLRKPTDTNFITADIALASCLYLTCSPIEQGITDRISSTGYVQCLSEV